jgi:CheY-like chemotaxis protein
MRSIFAPFCSLVEARDGLEALAACAQQLPDLIVTDVMMPNVSYASCYCRFGLTVQMDGFGLLTALKETKEYSMIPVIML